MPPVIWDPTSLELILREIYYLGMRRYRELQESPFNGNQFIHRIPTILNAVVESLAWEGDCEVFVYTAALDRNTQQPRDVVVASETFQASAAVHDIQTILCGVYGQSRARRILAQAHPFLPLHEPADAFIPFSQAILEECRNYDVLLPSLRALVDLTNKYGRAA
ncbi:hypothetical protein RhiJN_15040 [Ceratobasidium sp. AG-Ba]|nr:hypothetical protein RhiJN_15040 [Ceratobasidium sp. AG-Ba]